MAKKKTLPRAVLLSEMQTSKNLTESLRRTTQQTLDRVNRGKTDKNTIFYRAWDELINDINEAIEGEGDVINDKVVLDRICQEVKRAIESFTGEFNIRRGGLAATLVRKVRQEHRRVIEVVSSNYELENSSPEEKKKRRKKTANGTKKKVGVVTQELEAPGSSSNLFLFEFDDAETNLTFFKMTLEAHLESHFKNFMLRVARDVPGYDIYSQRLNEQELMLLETFTNQIEVTIKKFCEDAEIKFAEKSWEFKDFIPAIIDYLNNHKPSRLKKHYGALYNESDLIVRHIEEFYGRLIEFFNSQDPDSCQDFYDIKNPQTDVLSRDNFKAEKIFLSTKSRYISCRQDGLPWIDLPYIEYVIGLNPLEATMIYEEWKKLRTNEEDFLNANNRKIIARLVNENFHGGLSFRTPGDINSFIKDTIAPKEKETIETEKDFEERFNKFSANFLHKTLDSFLHNIFSKTLSFIRRSLEKNFEIDRGNLIHLNHNQYQKIAEVLNVFEEKMRHDFNVYITNYSQDKESMLDISNENAEPFRIVSFSLNKKKEEFLEQLLELKLELSPEELKILLEDVDIDKARFQVFSEELNLEEVGKEDYVLTVDSNKMIRELFFGIELSELIQQGKKYEGGMLNSEKGFIKNYLKLSLPDDASFTESRDVLEKSINSIAKLLNENLYGGFDFRSDNLVLQFCHKVLEEYFLEKNHEDLLVEPEEITFEVQERIRKSIKQAEGFLSKGKSQTFSKRIVRAYRDKLLPGVVESSPVKDTIFYLEKLEFLIEKALNEKGVFTVSSMTDIDFERFVSLPSMKGGRWGQLDRVALRLDDLTVRIDKVKEELDEKETQVVKHNTCLEREVELSKHLQIIEAVLGGYEDLFKEIYSETKQLYETAIGDPTINIDEEREKLLKKEKMYKEEKKAKIQEKEELCEELEEIRKEINRLTLVPQELNKLKRKYAYLCNERTLILEGLEGFRFGGGQMNIEEDATLAAFCGQLDTYFGVEETNDSIVDYSFKPTTFATGDVIDNDKEGNVDNKEEESSSGNDSKDKQIA